MQLQQISNQYKNKSIDINSDHNGVIEDEEIEKIHNYRIEFEEEALIIGKELKEIEQEIDDIEVKINNLKIHKMALQNMHELKRAPLIESMIMVGCKKIKGEQNTLSLSECRESVKVSDDKVVPEQYWRVTEKREINKEMLYKTIKNGITVPGVFLEKNVKLCIK